MEKKTKRGLNPLNIAPHVKVKGREGERLILLLRAAEPTVNTGDVCRALEQNGLTPPRHSCRLALLDGDLHPFR